MAGMGLRLVRSQGMEGISGNLNEFDIDPTNSNPIFTGDVVAFDGNGFVEEATGAAANDDFDILGVFMGCRYVDADGDYEFRNHWDGAANRVNVVAHVAVPPHSMFWIRGAAGTTYTRAATLGKRFGVVYNAGTPLYGDSRLTLGAAAAATGPLLIHRLVDLPNNTFDSDEPWFECSIVRPQGYPALAA
jgi:hypothetical protein